MENQTPSSSQTTAPDSFFNANKNFDSMFYRTVYRWEHTQVLRQKKFRRKDKKKLIKKKRPLSWRLYSIGGEGGKHSEKTSSAPIPPNLIHPPGRLPKRIATAAVLLFSIVHIFFTPKRKSAVAIELFYCKECTLSIVAVVVVSNSGIHTLSNRYSTLLVFLFLLLLLFLVAFTKLQLAKLATTA